ncbi:AarF/UbiB family protein [Brevundimonas diminuta]|uniref:ABC1 kinase family protein n=1 Tax=Brevundimonas diminuta TaxID=293 RepID=UPI002096D08C|nr:MULTISPECIES: AarF/UbiB family protein [Brevundimonas]MCO8031190.1 AarF/UbiB family protein [Brevundimonas diminuta]
MFTTLAVAARDRKRLAEISGVAARFGLEAVLLRLGLGGGGEDEAEGPEPLSRRTRQALEALGPTFVKLGQILSTRSDLLPADWIAEFEQLQSAGPTLDFETLRPEVEAALGGPPEQVFARFDATPLAAASIAQVHRAALHDGTAVVVKIRRPGVRPRVEADLRLIAELARRAEQSSAEIARYRPRALIAQLTEAMLDELDFTTEGRNVDRFAADFAKNRDVVIPAVYWQHTTDRVLVQDYLDGVAPIDAARLRAAGVDPHRLARVGAEAVLDMVLVNGRFHADPHPGNLRGLPGDRVGLLDFGMVGTVTPRRRAELISFVQSLAAGDGARMAEVLAEWTEGTDISRTSLTAGAERLIARHGQGVVDLPAIVADLMALMRQERVAAPPDLVLILKALVTIEGVLSRVDPDFDLVKTMKGAWSRALFSSRSPEALRNRLIGALLDLSAASDDLPRLIRAASRRLTAEPAATAASDKETARSILSAGRWIAASIVVSGALIAGALLFR